MSELRWFECKGRMMDGSNRFIIAEVEAEDRADAKWQFWHTIGLSVEGHPKIRLDMRTVREKT